MFCFFDHKAYGILVPQPGIKPAPLALEGEVLTAEPPGRSLPDSSIQSSLPSLTQSPASSLFQMLIMFFCVIHMGLELVLPRDTCSIELSLTACVAPFS